MNFFLSSIKEVIQASSLSFLAELIVGQNSVKIRLPLWMPNNFHLEFSSEDSTSCHMKAMPDSKYPVISPKSSFSLCSNSFCIKVRTYFFGSTSVFPLPRSMPNLSTESICSGATTESLSSSIVKRTQDVSAEKVT